MRNKQIEMIVFFDRPAYNRHDADNYYYILEINGCSMKLILGRRKKKMSKITNCIMRANFIYFTKMIRQNIQNLRPSVLLTK